ncbi:MAG: hypothetical protein AAF740_01125, partial [Bacteroidota bacterium]
MKNFIILLLLAIATHATGQEHGKTYRGFSSDTLIKDHFLIFKDDSAVTLRPVAKHFIWNLNSP